MGVGCTTQVTVGSDALSVCTKLRTGDHPTIETLVSNQGQVVFRTAVPIEDLKPIFAHSQEIVRRVEVQHSTILEEIQERGLEPTTQEPATPPSGDPPPQVPGLEKKLQRALAYLSKKDFALAERELREIFDRDPNFGEAQKLLEIVHAFGTEKAPPAASTSDRLRAGAEALTRGWKSSAIQNWARGLSADPSNRIFQLLVLLTTTPSAERRTNYVQELLSMGQKLISSGRSDEAHALLLALQAIEDPEVISPQLSGMPIGPTFSSDPSGPPNLKPTDTQPTLMNPPPALSTSMESGTATPAASSPAGLLVDQSLHEHPEREAALVEASEAEVEAARRKPVPRHRPSRRHFAAGALWEQLGLHPAIVLSGAGTLVLAAVGLVFFLGGNEERGNEQLQEAASLAATGQFDRAIAAYDQILKSGQFEALAYLGRGRARLAAGREEGLNDLTRAAELAPDSPQMLEELANGLYARGRFGEAATVYSKSISLGNDNANARYRLATSLVQVERLDEAVPHLEAALGTDASHGEARYLYGTLLNSMGRFAEAENELRGARTRFDPGCRLLRRARTRSPRPREARRSGRDREGLRALRSRGRLSTHATGRSLLEATAFRSRSSRAHHRIKNECRSTPRAIGPWPSLVGNRPVQGGSRRSRQSETDIAERSRNSGGRAPVDSRADLAGRERRVQRNQLLRERARPRWKSPSRSARSRRSSFCDAGFRGSGQGARIRRDPRSHRPRYCAIPGARSLANEGLPESSPGIPESRSPSRADQAGWRKSGPVVLPTPYVDVSVSFDVNQVIRDAYRRALAADGENKIASALKEIAESTSFVVSGPA